MNKELARFAIRSAFRSARELQELLLLLKEHASAEEYNSMRPGIATAIDAIGVGVTNKILAANPEIAQEIEASMETYDRFL